MRIIIEGKPEEIATAITGMQTAVTMQMQAMMGQIEAQRFGNAMKAICSMSKRARMLRAVIEMQPAGKEES